MQIVVCEFESPQPSQGVRSLWRVSGLCESAIGDRSPSPQPVKAVVRTIHTSIEAPQLQRQFSYEVAGDDKEQHGVYSTQPVLAHAMTHAHAERGSDHDSGHHRGED